MDIIRNAGMLILHAYMVHPWTLVFLCDNASVNVFPRTTSFRVADSHQTHLSLGKSSGAIQAGAAVRMNGILEAGVRTVVLASDLELLWWHLSSCVSLRAFFKTSKSTHLPPLSFIF